MLRTLSSNLLLLNLWAFFAAFTTYFFMYMFRKPFTAAAFESASESAWDGKSVIVSAQVIGYFCSKLIGIRVVSSIPAVQRAWALLGLIGVAQVALLLFAVLPAPWHIAAIFLNGLPLGMVFGLVLGFLEGRKVTEALVAGLCASFIVAGGASKSVGQWMLNLLVYNFDFSLIQAERWMPFLAGSLFLIPIAITAWMLAQIPPPTDSDTHARSERTTMTTKDRRVMLARYGIGIGAVSVLYLLVTILRSLRDDFAPQILGGMGATVSPSDYSLIDIQVALFVLVINGLTSLIKNNRLALQTSLVISLAGFALIAAALSKSQMFSPTTFMVLIGAGLYLPYVAVHTTVFERLIALTRDRGNMSFLMYIVDSLGYLGYVVVLFLPKSVVIGGGSSDEAFYLDFRWYCWVVALLSLVATLVALIYFSLLKADINRKLD
jgi:Family of unknown function (DUF5690)